MAMNAAYLNAIRDHGQSLITHIALFGDGAELSGGGYARLPVTWVDDGTGVSRPSANLVFTTDAVSGGVAGKSVRLVNRIATAGGRVDERSHRLSITDR